MLDELTPAEFRAWSEYATVEPFGEERADLRAGIVACTVANCAPGKKRRRFKPKDFMPRFGKRRPQTNEQMYAIAMAFAHAHNASQAVGRRL